MKLMVLLCPTPGEKGAIRKASELGRRGYGLLIGHSCVDCGCLRWVRLLKGMPQRQRCRSCAQKKSRAQEEGRAQLFGPNSPRWKGGRRLTPQGYIEIRVQYNDFFSPMIQKKNIRRGRGGYVTEHRLVMAKYLNRCLLPWEIVHHRNGIKDDNHIENLELIRGMGRHNTRLHNELKRQAEQIKELQARVTQLEAELVISRAEAILAKMEER